MKFKNIIPYTLIFLASFIITPVTITTFVKKANGDAREYVEQFKPVTSNLPNGIYQGKFKAFNILTMSKVEFVIENSIVKNFEFKRLFHSPGSIYKDEIENKIIQAQKLEVNAISGATRTSNFAKAAIKNAIENKNSKYLDL